MKTTTILLTATTASVIAVGVLFKIGLDEIKKETVKRQEIQAWKEAELASIRQSSAIVNEKIWNGDYDGKPLADVFSDMEFYRIAIREEQ
jgi:hypothetical protein